MSTHPDEGALLFLDIAAAYPSLAQAWLAAVLKKLDILPAFRATVAAVSAFVPAYTVITGIPSFAFWVLGGVQQGCPLSTPLFTLAMNPFLRAFAHACNPTTNPPPEPFPPPTPAQLPPNNIPLPQDIRSNKGGAIRGYADDLGTVIREAQILKNVAAILTVMAKTANLVINSEKCILVPLANSPFEIAALKWNNFISNNVPALSGFRIQDKGKYLGYWLGPQAPHQLQAPLNKLDKITSQLAKAKLPLSVATTIYNRHGPPSLRSTPSCPSRLRTSEEMMLDTTTRSRTCLAPTSRSGSTLRL